MTPGLANGPPFPAKAQKGAVVAVASLENPSVPVTVGVCLVDVSALGSVQGSRGHAVQTMHWAGDELWAYSTSNKAGVNPPDSIDGWLPREVDEGEIAQQTSSMTLEDEEEGGVVLGQKSNGKGVATEEADDEPAKEETVAEAEVAQMTTKGAFSSIHPQGSSQTNLLQKSTKLSAKPSYMAFINT